MLKGAKISSSIPLLRGSFSSWIFHELGIPVGAPIIQPMQLFSSKIKMSNLIKGLFFMVNHLQPRSIYPSVRCGLEMAVLNAIAGRKGCSLLDVLQHRLVEEDDLSSSSKVKICGLLDSGGTPSEVARVAKTLVEEGFPAIKLKASCITIF